MQEGGEGVSGVLPENESWNEVESGVSDLNTEDTATEESTSDEYNPKESARETVERVLKETTESVDGDKGQAKTQKKTPEFNAVEEKPQQGKTKEESFDPDLSPPERLSAYEKQLFNNLPKGLKRAFSKTVKNLEATTTRANQEAYKRVQEAETSSRSIVEAVRPYLAEWGEQGFAPHEAIAALAAAHAKLTNPATARDAYEKLGRDLGIQSLPQSQSGQVQADISNHPEVLALKNELTSLRQQLEPVYFNHQRNYQEQIQGKANEIAAEIAAVRDEIDASGRYVYPKLHDDEFLLSKVKPLVSELIRNVPGLSYAEATKRAYLSIEGFSNSGISQSTNQTRLPVNNNQIQQRAAQAAVSVRGRIGSPSSSNQTPPPEALGSARDTVAWALESLRRGA